MRVLFFELFLAGLGVLLALFVPSRLLQTPWRWLRWGGSRRNVAALVVAGLLVIAAATIHGVVARREPAIHDEFSYLLAGDTFAHGRLANPPHPFWAHFETPHVLQQPNYASKYPPAQGLFLALGRRLCGAPLAGVWLSLGLLSAALTWMLRAWMPGRWALFGGTLASVRLAFLGGFLPTLDLGYWASSAWGGAVAALGGCLLLGAAGRLAREISFRNAVILAVGAGVLANSRPVEGAILGVPAVVFVVSRQWAGRARLFRRGILPGLAVLLCFAAAMGYYNRRVTGSPLRHPYQVYEAQYGTTPPFLWQEPRPVPDYRHQTIRDLMAGWAPAAFEEQQSLSGLLKGAGSKLWRLALFFYGPLLFLPMVFSVRGASQSSRTRWLAWLTVPVLLATCAETWFWPHYAAPAAGLFFLWATLGLRRLAACTVEGRRAGRTIVALILLGEVAAVPLAVAHNRSLRDERWTSERARVQQQLNAAGGMQLVLVRFGEQADPHESWIVNSADINRSDVVFARALSSAADCRLVRYFHDRRAWLLTVDVPPPRLEPYPERCDAPESAR